MSFTSSYPGPQRPVVQHIGRGAEKLIYQPIIHYQLQMMIKTKLGVLPPKLLVTVQVKVLQDVEYKLVVLEARF